MTVYRRSVSADGASYVYLKAVGDEWVSVTDEEARAVGVWRDARGGQYHVRDHMATAEQLAAREAGRYDPRPASGAHVADLVVVRCVECGARVADVAQFERRRLARNVQTGRWYRDLDRWSPFQCLACDRDRGEVDVDKIAKVAARAASEGRKLTVKV